MEIQAEEFAGRLAVVLHAPDPAQGILEYRDSEPADLAAACRHLQEDDIVELLKLLPEEISADVIVELGDDLREDILQRLTPKEIADVVEEMATDDAADVVSELEEAKAVEVVDLLEEEDRREIAVLLSYPEDSAGGIMRLEVVWVRSDRTAARAIEKIRELYGEVREDFYIVYVTDREGTLLGRIPLPRLILADPDARVTDVMEEIGQQAYAEQDQEEVAKIFRKYDLVSLPVVDRDQKLLGVITVDDIVDVIHEEAEEDYSRLAGTDEEEFQEESVLRKASLRLPWLVTGLVGGVLSAVVLSRFETSLRSVIALTFFVPVIMAMGGNVAIQSSAVMVRGLALGEINARDGMARLGRELGVSVITGAVCAILIFFAAWLWWNDIRLGIVVGGAMLAVILISTSVGAFVPLSLDRFRIDPALATGPFVTTSNDILGILIYLSLASWIYGGVG
ncbi:MAG: magnesium transporter MgtE [Gemmatimonadota bacterium]|nr:MAG: magnesium transporter MgtE [Gemmatimonadota bacterium]